MSLGQRDYNIGNVLIPRGVSLCYSHKETGISGFWVWMVALYTTY